MASPSTPPPATSASAARPGMHDIAGGVRRWFIPELETMRSRALLWTSEPTEFVAPVVLVGLFLCVCCSALLFLVCVWRCVNRRGARARTRPTQVVLPPLPERGPPPPFADVMYAGK